MEKIGRYQIVRELGRGGMGVVYEATDPVIERRVALKTIRNSEGLSAAVYEELRERFLREARAAGRLQHPGITSVLDAGTDPESGVSYIAIEYVRGRDLESELRSGRRFTPAEAEELVASVADALDYAHAAGVVHRDIKPANLLLDETGRVKVTDFGIAHVAESGLTRTGQILGSPAYMSPEQISGAAVDGRSDIFSLGVVLYQLLTGERPFQGEALTTLAYQIVHTDPIPARKVNPSLAASLESVLARALAKSPADRYQRARDLAQDLKGGTMLGAGTAPQGAPRAGTLVAAPIPATPTGTVLGASPVAPTAGEPAHAPSRTRAWIALGAGALLLVVLGLWLSSRGGQEPAGSSVAAPRRSEPVVPSQSEPSGREASTASGQANVHLDCEHHLSSGTVTVAVDGEVVWSSPLRARKDTKLSIPGVKKGPRLQMSHEQLDADVVVPAGRHTVTARMRSGESGVDDSDTKTVTLRDGQATVWKVRVNRLTKNVSLDVSP